MVKRRRREIPVDFVCSMIDLSDFWVVAIPIEFGRRESSEQKLGRWTIGRWYRRYFGISSPANERLPQRFAGYPPKQM